MVKKYHYLYKITNKINDKIYIGIHSTDDLDDGYFGSGYLLWKSIDKHGICNFQKEILSFKPTRKLISKMERRLVNKHFIKLNSNYNITVGGDDNVMSGPRSVKIRKNMSKARIAYFENNPMVREIYSDRQKAFLKDNPDHMKNIGKKLKEKYKNPEFAEKHRQRTIEGSRTKESIRKNSEAQKAYRTRSWKVPIVISKPEVREVYLKLDIIYKLYTNYNFKERGSYPKFESEYKKIFNKYPTKGIYSYLEKYGDPTKDVEWLKFKEEYE